MVLIEGARRFLRKLFGGHDKVRADLPAILTGDRLVQHIGRIALSPHACAGEDNDLSDFATALAAQQSRGVQLHLFIQATCLGELARDIALRQILRWEAVLLFPYFVFPTDSAAALAELQARQRDADQLGKFLSWRDAAEQLSELPDDSLICTMNAGASLTRSFAGAFEAVHGRRTLAEASVGDDGSVIALFRKAMLHGQIMCRRWHLPSKLPVEDADFPSITTHDISERSDTHNFGLSLYRQNSQLHIDARIPNGVCDAVLELSAGSRVFHRSSIGGGGVKITASLPLDLVKRKEVHCKSALFQQDSEVASDSLDTHVRPTELSREMVTCYQNRGGGGNAMIRAFANGIGAPLRFAEDETGPRPGIPVVWGVLRGSDKVVRFAQENGQYFFYIDHAYFNRGHGHSYRVTRDRYEAGPLRDCPPDRLDALTIKPKPWRKDGSIILVCPPTDYFMQAHDCHAWLEQTLERLATVTDRPVVVRNKPEPGEPFDPLEQVLERTHALVTHSSNVAIEAVVSGTPVFVSPTSAAASVGLCDLGQIETPIYPERDRWLAHLAYSQFSMDEIASGTAWSLLMEFEHRPLL